MFLMVKIENIDIKKSIKWPTIPQYPGLKIPTPPAGQMLEPALSQRTSIRSAMILRLKQDERSVDTTIVDSLPITDQGSMLDGILGPPASKPGNEIA